MKKFFVFSFLLLISSLVSNIYAEAFKFRASAIAYQITDDYGNWKKWSDWQNSSALIVYNGNDNRYTIYEKDTKNFDIISPMEKDGADWICRCIDQYGEQCTIRTHEEGEQLQIYIEFVNFKMVFNVRVI